MNFTPEELQEFKAEADELLQEAENELLRMEDSNSYAQSYSSVFRAFHSLKGASGMLGLDRLKDHVHRLESMFSQYETAGSLSAAATNFFLAGIDAAKVLLNGSDVQFDYTLDSQPKKIEHPLETKELTPSLPCIFVIDDEQDNLDIIKTMLKNSKYHMEFFTSPLEALSRCEASMPDLILTDMRMPELTGMDVLKRVLEMDSDVPVIFISSYLDKLTLMDALNLGVFAVLEKPIKEGALLSYITQGLSRREMWHLLNRSIDMILFQLNDMEKFLLSQGRKDSVTIMKEDARTLLAARRALRLKPT